MRDFDKERSEAHAQRLELLGDTSFRFGGELFHWDPNPHYDFLRQVEEVGTETGGGDVIRVLEQTISNLLATDDDRERFAEVCARKTGDIVTFQDLNSLAMWLIEEQVKTPTLAPSPSTDGDAQTPTDLKGNSSSPLAEASAA